nr:LysM peptidoglycan-binding domain-containing protein [Geobacillus sp. JS12]
MKKTVVLTSTLIGSLLAGHAASAASYTVQKGDTLWKIARQSGTTVAALKQENDLSSDLIFPGQVLRVNEPNESNESSSNTYTVEPGDTLSGIARKFGTTVDALLKLNPSIANPDFIRAGQKLQVAGDRNVPIHTMCSRQPCRQAAGISCRRGIRCLRLRTSFKRRSTVYWH